MDEDEGRERVDFLDDNLPHIFRKAPGHVQDTPQNRASLLALVNGTEPIGINAYGAVWYARIQPDGSQLWAMTFAGTIRNAGLNPVAVDLVTRNRLKAGSR